MQNRIYRNDVQSLRGIAVIAVIFYHGDKYCFPQGFLGVDVFFVISGFVVTPLMMEILHVPKINRKFLFLNLKKFYVNRFYRLAPALITMLIASSFMIFFLGPTNDHQRFAKQGIATIFLAGNWGAYKYFGDYFAPNTNPLIHTWSLSVEEQIYFVLPFLLVIFLLRYRNVKVVTLVLFLFLGVASLVSFLFSNFLAPFYSLFGINSVSLFAFYSPIDRFWQFSVGGLLFLVLKNYAFKDQGKLKIVSFIFLVILLLCLFGRFELSSKFEALMVTLVTLVVIGFKSLELLPSFMNKPLVWFGYRSYSLYLLHMPMIYLAKYSPIFQLNTNGDRRFQIYVAILLTIILANFSYYNIENRFRKSSVNLSTTHISPLQAIASFTISLLFFMGISISSSMAMFRDLNSPIPSKISPADWDENCKFHQPSLPPRNSPCLYKNIGSQKNYLLIGDSHAAYLSKTLIRIGEENKANVYIWTHSACPFILNPTVLESKQRFPLFTTECLAHNRQVIEFLNKTKIETVFYSQRSAVPYLVPTTIDNLHNLNSLIYSGLLEIEKRTDNLLFIGITPEYSAVNTVLLKLLGHEGFYRDLPQIDNSVWSKKLRMSKIKYIDVYEKFCTLSNQCINKVNDEWLFEDGDHLSNTGGKHIRNTVMDSLQKDDAASVKK